MTYTRVFLCLCLLAGALTAEANGPTSLPPSEQPNTTSSGSPAGRETDKATPPKTTNSAPSELPKKNETKLPAGPNDPQSAWERLDGTLEAALAATLAGLAVAVATFLMAATAPLAAEIRALLQNRDIPNPAKTRRLEKMKKSVNQLMWSFYWFVGMLVETLTLDHWEAPGAWLGQYDLAAYSDVVVSGGLLGLGVYCLGRGTATLRTLILEDDA